MKRIALFILGVLVIVGMSACSGLSQDDFNFPLDNDQEILAFQALSSINMMESQPAQSLSNSRISRMSDEQVTSIDMITPYLELFEQILTQSNGLSVTTETSDLAEYETKQVFTVTVLLEEQVTYTMYYSKIVSEDETSDEENDEIEDKEDHNDDNDEQEYSIEGILIQGDMTYTIKGKHEIEDNEDKIEFTAMMSETDYVTVTYKLEDEETKFAYRIYTNGNLESESTIKIETEDNEFKIELSYTQGENFGDYEFKMEDEDGESILKIEFQSTIDGIETEGEAKVKVVYDELTQEAHYTIIVKGNDDEEHEETHERDMDIDDDEEDDDNEEDDKDDNDKYRYIKDY